MSEFWDGRKVHSVLLAGDQIARYSVGGESKIVMENGEMALVAWIRFHSTAGEKFFINTKHCAWIEFSLPEEVERSPFAEKECQTEAP